MRVQSPGRFRLPLSGLTRLWRSWRGNQAGVAEIRKCGPEQLQVLARDIGTSRNDLQALAGKWPDSSDLLTRRMAALNMDFSELRSSQPAVARDMQRVCAICATRPQCEHDLDRKPADCSWRSYCPNTATLDALAGESKTSHFGNGSR